ncbi:MAG: hypothetical protein CR974_03400 [Gammaproteobacteria bacterium]|nr:MAG: hypothetical protein CR974_03400 [Gammaproteobacteria bacterium]
MNRLIKIAVLPVMALVFNQWAIAQGNILPYWQTQMQHIDKGLNDLQQRYQQGEKKIALEISKTTHFTHYRNSDLEASIRTNVSMKTAEAINLAFFDLSSLIGEDGNHTQEIHTIANQLSIDIQQTLPDLPLTPRLMRQQAAHLAKKEAERIEKKDYRDDIQSLNTALTQVISDYQAGEKKSALTSIQDNFYQHWQRSDLAASVSANYKQSVEQHFDALYKSIQQDKPTADVSQRVQQLQSTLQKAEQHKVKNTPTNGTPWQWIVACLAVLVGIGVIFLAIKLKTSVHDKNKRRGLT